MSYCTKSYRCYVKSLYSQKLVFEFQLGSSSRKAAEKLEDMMNTAALREFILGNDLKIDFRRL